MTPFHFGDSESPLFGVHWEPGTSAPIRDRAVLLCPTHGVQYMRLHWAYRQLATLLLREGCHVLAFDYEGCGDSAGDTLDGTPEDWRKSIVMAATEVCDMTGARELAALGTDLGAILLAGAMSELRGVTDCVLWDPVISGSDWLCDMKRAQNVMLRNRRMASLPDEFPSRHCGELFGYPFSREMVAQLNALDLGAYDACNAQRVHIVSSTDCGAVRELEKKLKTQGSAVTLRVMQQTEQWDELAYSVRAAMDITVLREIAGLLAGGAE